MRTMLVISLIAIVGCSGSGSTPAPSTETPATPTATPTPTGGTPTTPTTPPTTAPAEVVSSIVSRAPTPATGCPATDPAAANAPGTVHSGRMNGPETLDMAGSPHRFPDGLDIEENGVLSIEPCTLVLVGDNHGIVAYDGATMIAEGAEGRPITLKSDHADAQKGAWHGVYFRGNARPTSRLHHVLVENAGGDSGYSYPGAVWAAGGFALDAQHLTIRGSKNHGVSLTEQSKFTPTSTQLVVEASGVTDAETAPVYFYDANAVGTLPEGRYVTNAADEILVEGHELRSTQTWRNPGVRYRLKSGLEIGAPNGAVLTVAPGATLAFASDQHLMVGYSEDGGIVLDGLAEATRITLTSARPSPEAGDWKGIFLGEKTMRTQTKLDFVTIAFAGGDVVYGPAHYCGESTPYAILINERDLGPKITHTKFVSLTATAQAIRRGFRSATPTDFTAANLGNDFGEYGGACRQSFAPPVDGCPDPVPACN